MTNGAPEFQQWGQGDYDRERKDNACADGLSRCLGAPAPAKGITEAEAQVLLCEADDNYLHTIQRRTHQ